MIHDHEHALLSLFVFFFKNTDRSPSSHCSTCAILCVHLSNSWAPVHFSFFCYFDVISYHSDL